MKEMYHVKGTVNRGFVGQITYTVCLEQPCTALDIHLTYDFAELRYRDDDVTPEEKEKYFKTEDPAMIETYGKMLDALRLIRTVFAIGFTSKNTEKFRPAIIEMSRQVFFPNIQNIVAGVKFLVNTVNTLYPV
mgnify:CR=1 FL=1